MEDGMKTLKFFDMRNFNILLIFIASFFIYGEYQK